MRDVLITACTYMSTMFLAYALKRVGIFCVEDRQVIGNLLFNVTLPAMLVGGFSSIEPDLWFVIAFVLGIGVNALMVMMACVASRKKSPDIKGIYTINGAGLNIAGLGIPFLQNFFPAALPYLCMFDTGDSFFSLGTTYAIARVRMGDKDDEPAGILSKIITLVKSWTTSVPMMVYVLMTLLSLLKIRLPEPVLEIADFMGRGNGFLAMTMVGISLELRIDREAIREVLSIMFLRYVSGTICALLIYFLLPAPLIMRQALAPAMFVAVPNVCLIYSCRLDVRTDIPSMLNPLSALLMIPVMSIVILFVR